jgi:alkanesulfonate monooxygenase SsuD/methylene tetrahydromethanopterin reductase-like flavin-dependent oxidoreductase (luciferase family)
MRIGVVLLPQRRWAQEAERWRAVEQLGFDHAWTYDHLAWRDLADQPWFATVPTLAAASLVTSTVGLGTWVASPNFRHPVPFAKDLMSLDDLSGGRMLLGVGAGGTGWDAGVLGVEEPTPGQRVKRLAEFVHLLDLLLTRPETTWRGEWFEAVQARMVPGSTQRPRMPFVLAANGPRAVRLAAEHCRRTGDSWATTGITSADDGPAAWWNGLAEVTARFTEHLDAGEQREVGEQPDAGGRRPIRRYLNLDSGPQFSLTSAGHFADVVGRAGELGFTDVVTHWPRAEGVYAGDVRVLEQIAADLPALRSS